MIVIFVKIFKTFFNDKWDNNYGNNFNINVSVFIGIRNDMSICYKFQNDFNDYFQDKNNKNINDYKSIYTNNDDKDKYFIYFSNFIMIDKGNIIDNFNKETNKILSKIKDKENKDSKIKDYFHIFNNIND